MTTAAPPPDRLAAAAGAPRRYRWVILAVGVAAQVAPAGVHQGLPAIGPELRDRYGLSLAGLGALLAAFIAGMIVMVLPWGALADRVGERVVIGAGLVAAAAPVALATVTSGAVATGAALFVAGMLAASANAASGRAVVGWFAASERGLALGVRHMAT
ncbi:MAG: MFS transporter, partial [Actinomycetota bacterium]